MTLQFNRDSLDGLTDAESQHYTKKGEGFVLDVDDVKDERVQGLIKNKNEALAEKEKLQRRVTKLEKSSGGDSALNDAKMKISDLEKQVKETGKAGKFTEDQVAQIKKDVEAGFKEELAKRDADLKSIRDRSAASQRDGAIKDALVKAGVKKGALDMATSYLRDRVESVEGETGESVLRIKKTDGAGHEVSKNADGVYKTVGEFVGELKINPDYGFAFDGSKASGGGAEANLKTGTNGAAETGNFANIKARSDLRTHADKTAFLQHLKKQNNDDEQKAQDAYFALPAERSAP